MLCHIISPYLNFSASLRFLADAILERSTPRAATLSPKYGEAARFGKRESVETDLNRSNDRMWSGPAPPRAPRLSCSPLASNQGSAFVQRQFGVLANDVLPSMH